MPVFVSSVCAAFTPDSAYGRIDPLRNAEVAKTFFGYTICNMVLVYDPLSSCKGPVKVLDGKIVLRWFRAQSAWPYPQREWL